MARAGPASAKPSHRVCDDHAMQPDSSSRQCQLCGSTFSTFTNRRHHVRCNVGLGCSTWRLTVFALASAASAVCCCVAPAPRNGFHCSATTTALHPNDRVMVASTACVRTTRRHRPASPSSRRCQRAARKVSAAAPRAGACCRIAHQHAYEPLWVWSQM